VKGKLNIEQLFSTKLTDAEIAASSRTWSKIIRRVRWQQFLQFKPWQLNIYTLGGILIIGVGSIFILSHKKYQTDVSQNENIINKAEQESSAALVQTGEPSLSDMSSTNQEVRVEMENERSQTPSDLEDKTSSSLPKREVKIKSLSDASELDQNESTESLPSGSDPDLHPPFPRFIPSVSSGCAPLEVSFVNRSEYAVAYQWLFDESGVSTERDPVLTLNEPGKYTITLIAVNEEGESKRTQQFIEVYPAPKANFEIGKAVDGLEGIRESALLNLSSDALAFHWSTKGGATNWTSAEYEPLLRSNSVGEEGGYLQLVAMSEKGCTDTIVREIPKDLVEVSPYLQFPTAFSPNETGPIGGHYSPNEKRIDIFHPVFTEAPLEYHLKIYTRRGELVFESDNIYIGWDGYYLQERSASGVYVWMAEGRWSGGRTFSLRGDITLLWNNYH